MVPESGARPCWGPSEDRVHLPSLPRNRGASLAQTWWAGPGFSGTLIGQSGAPAPLGSSPRGPRPPQGGSWLWPPLRPAGPLLSPSAPPGSLLSTSLFLPSLPSPPLLPASPSPFLSSFLSSPMILPILFPLPSPLSSPDRSPPLAPRGPLPCIMHAVEAPNRIRHLRPSLRRESLCK